MNYQQYDFTQHPGKLTGMATRQRSYLSPAHSPPRRQSEGDMSIPQMPFGRRAFQDHDGIDNNQALNNIIVNINGSTHINNYPNQSPALHGNAHPMSASGYNNSSSIQGRKVDMPQLRVGQNLEDSNEVLRKPTAGNQQLQQIPPMPTNGRRKSTGGAVAKTQKQQKVGKTALSNTGKSNGHQEGMKQFLQQTLNVPLNSTGASNMQKSSKTMKGEKNQKYQTQNFNFRLPIGDDLDRSRQVPYDFDMPAVREAAINPGTHLGSPEPERIHPTGTSTGNQNSFFYSTNKQSLKAGDAYNTRPRSGGSNLPPKKSGPSSKPKDSKHSRIPSASNALTKTKRDNSTARSRPLGGHPSSQTRPTPKLQRTNQQSALKQQPPLTKKSGKGDGLGKKKGDKASKRKDLSMQGTTVLEKKWCRTNIDGRSMKSDSSGDGENRSKQTVSIAQQLSKNYFLNSKQLLRHLSPTRETQKIIGAGQQPEKFKSNTTADVRQMISEPSKQRAAVREIGVSSGLATQQRARNKSTNEHRDYYATSQERRRRDHPLRQRRTQSVSQTRQSKNRHMDDQLNESVALSNKYAKKVSSPTTGQANTQAVTRMPSNSRKQNNSQAMTPTTGGYVQLRSNAQKVDKLIKENIRKNKSKAAEQSLQKQLQNLKQQRRREELTQRNHEVRMINASKINCAGSRAVNDEQQYPSGGGTYYSKSYKRDHDVSQEVGPVTSSQLSQQSERPKHNVRRTYDKRRSQSCIDGWSNIGARSRRGPSSIGEKQPASSYGTRKQSDVDSKRNHIDSNAYRSKEIARAQQKPIPHTTKNFVEEIGGKPRSFVDEIKQLTHQVEREIGHNSVRIDSSTGHNQKASLKLKLSQQHRSQNQESAAASICGPDNNYMERVGNENYLSAEKNTSNLQNNGSKKSAHAASAASGKQRSQSKRTSSQLQKFIEKKKKQLQIKKNMELTLEVGKQLQIQKNLLNLNQYVKKHMRQSSQPAVKRRQSQDHNQSNISKVTQKKTKKHTKNANSSIIDITDIFNEYDRNHLLQSKLQETTARDSQQPQRKKRKRLTQGVVAQSVNITTTQAPLSEDRFENPRSDVLSDQEMQDQYHKGLPKGRPRGILMLNESSGRGPPQSQQQNYFPESQSAPQPREEEIKQVQLTQPMKTSKPQRGPAHPLLPPSVHGKPSTNYAQEMQQQRDQQKQWEPANEKNASRRADTEESWHHEKDKKTSSKIKITENYSDQQFKRRDDIQDQIAIQKLAKERAQAIATEQKQQNQNQSSQIRRIHELVALYRCRFKSNASDAAVMGTLHSAASVIQIHFRYLRHLKESGAAGAKKAEVQKRTIDTTKLLKSSIQQEQNDLYIDSDEEFDDSRQPKENQTLKVDSEDQYLVTQSRIDPTIGPESSQFIDTSEKLGKTLNFKLNQDDEKEVLKEKKNDAKGLALIQSLETQQRAHRKAREQQEMQTNQKKQSRPFTEYSRPEKNGNDIQILDGRMSQESEQLAVQLRDRPQTVEDKHQDSQFQRKELNQSSQYHQSEKTQNAELDHLNSSMMSKGRKTPHIPILDFGKVQQPKTDTIDQAKKDTYSQSIEKKMKEVDVENIDGTEEDGEGEQPDSQLDGPLTASSYSGIFRKIGLPLPRSARVKVDYDLINKDPAISAQLKEIIQLKQQRGVQIMEDGHRDALISERTFIKNKGRLEKWVNASLGRVNDRLAIKSNALGLSDTKEPSSASRKQMMKTNDELLAETSQQRQHLAQLFSNIDERQSMQSGTRRSARAFTGRSRQSLGSQRDKQTFKEGPINGKLALEDPKMQGLFGRSQRQSAVKLEDENGGEQLAKGGRHSMSEYSNNPDKPIGSSRAENSKIMQMIIDSQASQREQQEDEGSQVESSRDPEARNQTGNDVVPFADIQLDLDRWKLMQLGDHRDASDMQSNPFASNSSANEFFSPGLHGNVQTALLRKNQASGQSSDQQSSSIQDDQAMEPPSQQKTEKSLLNRTTSLNLMFQGAPPNLKDLKDLVSTDGLDDDLDEIPDNPVGDLVDKLDQVLHVEQKKKQLSNNFLVDSNEESRAHSRDSSERILQQEQIGKETDNLQIGQKVNVSSVTSNDTEQQQPSQKVEVQQQPVQEIISDASFFLKQLDERGAQAQETFLDIEDQQIEVIHHGKDPSFEDLGEIKSPQHISGQITLQTDPNQKSGQVNLAEQNKLNESLNASSNKKDSDRVDKEGEHDRTKATVATNNSTIILDQTFPNMSESPNKLIKVENQKGDDQSSAKEQKNESDYVDSQPQSSKVSADEQSPSNQNIFEDMNKKPQGTSDAYEPQELGEEKLELPDKASLQQKKQIQLESGPQDTQALGMPVSPLSENHEFKITTGAHSLSSTDSDMAKAIHAVNKPPALDSPPNLISPKNGAGESMQPLLLNVEDQLQEKRKEEMNRFADEMTLYLLGQMLSELSIDLHSILPRPSLYQRYQAPQIKFFEKKGIKTDLFAIEKYVDEVLEDVQVNKSNFMKELAKPIGKNAREHLKQMQNDEIGNFDHFHLEYPPVLNLDLYLKLEKRRKESREPRNQKEGVNPDGRFDFDPVTNDELRRDSVDRNFLSECQHIHNKVLFDCINDSLQQFRPHGKEGKPMVWSRQSRKLKPTEDFTMEEIFEITKHDLFRMAIMQAGTLPRKEFVFGGHFDEELFAEIREKKLATLLVREIVETEPQWLKWDFEEAQTKIDLADMVLEQLVTETISFLNTKNEKPQKEENKTENEK